MDDITQKREKLKTAYKSESWAQRVDGMPDEQVVAIYLRLHAQGKV